jgi:CRP-like cAMP-binding protein
MTVFNQALARKRAGKMNLDKGTELCREGDIGRALYFVLEGELEVRIAGQVVATIEKGELVGEIAVLLKEHPKRTASIKAVENSTLASISALDFGNTVMEHPNILNSLASILSRRIESTNHMIVDMETAISTELENLSSAPESCEAVFLRLASSLPPSFSKEIDLCKGHAQRALKASKNMSGTYQEIIKRINETH